MFCLYASKGAFPMKNLADLNPVLKNAPDQAPIWMVVELLTFQEVSILFFKSEKSS